MLDQGSFVAKLPASSAASGQKIEARRAALLSRDIVLGSFLLHFSLWPYASEQRSRVESHISNRLAGLRAERGLTRRELAAALHLSLATLQALEAGSYVPTLALALHVSRYFSLAVEDIFAFS